MVVRSELYFDFYVHAAGKLKLHQGIYSLRCAAVDVDETLVGGELELLAALLVDEGGAVDSDDALTCGQWDRTANNGSCCFDVLHDFLCALLYECVVVALEFDANLLTHSVVLFVLVIGGCLSAFLLLP